MHIAKYHNKFGGAKAYMREFARICISDRHLGKRLESIMNSEIAI
jgi:hypothetical protein